LKAIVAHEFGHFAQNATKLGSYIYTVNRVIFDLVYMRDKWDQTLAKWSRTFSLFNFFAQLTFMIVSGVRFVLRKIYYLIQRINGALSREMEFHADRVAVSVTGSEPICDALLKLQILKIVHDSVSRLVDNYFDDRKIIPANVFDLYEPVAFQLSKQTFVCTSENHFPKFNESDMRKIDSLKRLKASNLWASHPQFNERKEAAYRIFVDRLNQPGNAIELIRNPNQLGRKVTKLMIRKDITKFISDSPETIAELMAIHDKQVYDARYRGFYYGRILQQFDIEASVNKPVIQIDTEEKIFNEELESGFDALRACDADINALKSFATSAESFGYFEYEGKRCDKFDIQRIDKLLGERQKKILNELAQYEQRIFQMYLKNSGEYRLKYIGEYKLYFTILGFRNAVKEELSAAMKMNKGFGKITQYTGGVEKALIERANAICSRFINLIEKMDRVVSVLDYDELHVANGLGKHLCKTLPSLQEKPFQIAKFYGLNTSIAAVNAGLNRILQIQLRAIIRIQDQIHAGASRQ
ncbi:MAG TPA: M48 family metalloprotease, partial [Bacteroidia bacterium]|nr:M48 family metalloprotease [Bacteroidia bacterium]